MTPTKDRVSRAAVLAENHFWMKLQAQFADVARDRLEFDEADGRLLQEIADRWVRKNTRLFDPAAGASVALSAAAGRR